MFCYFPHPILTRFFCFWDIKNNDKQVNRKLGKKRVKILMDENSSDDEPKITKFQVTSVHDGKKLSFVFSFVIGRDNLFFGN
jgi:hypothetical protein